uniref:Uncharacterized protein n=1 Tax=Knipowitschia caucasica TaxID=637954 RepID=A0AAV2JM07_KNICA
MPYGTLYCEEMVVVRGPRGSLLFDTTPGISCDTLTLILRVAHRPQCGQIYMGQYCTVRCDGLSCAFCSVQSIHNGGVWLIPEQGMWVRTLWSGAPHKSQHTLVPRARCFSYSLRSSLGISPWFGAVWPVKGIREALLCFLACTHILSEFKISPCAMKTQLYAR